MAWKRRRTPPAEPTSPSSAWSSEIEAPDRAPIDWSFRPDTDQPADRSDPVTVPAGSRWRTAAAGAAAVATLGIAAVAITDGEGDDASGEPIDEAAADDPLTPTTLDTLPDAGPSTTARTVPPTTVADPSPLDGMEPGAAPSPRLTRTPPTRTSVVELPPDLPDFEQAFELVMSTADGIATLSFPSGILRTTELDRAPTPIGDFGALVVGPAAALLVDSGGALIIPDRGEPREVALDSPRIQPIGWQTIDGETSFTLFEWTGIDDARVLDLRSDGRIEPQGVTSGLLSFQTERSGRLFFDGGGVFLTDTDGVTARLTDGQLLGYANGRALIRSCDAAYVCRAATVDVESGDRTVFAAGSEAELDALYRWNSTAPAPDGDTVAIVAPDDRGVPMDVVVRSDGSSITVRHDAAILDGSAAAWAPDSSGFFRALPRFRDDERPSLTFVTIDGDVVELADLPLDVRTVGIRSIDAERPADDDTDIATALGGVSVVGIAGDRAVVVDGATGDLVGWDVPDMGRRPDLEVVDGALVAIAEDGTRAVRSRFGLVVDERLEIDDPITGPRYRASDDRLTWRPGDDDGTVELVPIVFHDRGGSTPWRTLEVTPDDVLGTDGAGGLVWTAEGDLFVSTGSATRLVGSGDLVAIGPDAALVRVCESECRDDLVGTDGSVARLVGPSTSALPVELPADRPVDGSMSPDGDVVFVALDPTTPSVSSDAAFIDLGVGEVVAAPLPDPGRRVHWTDDGATAVYLADGRIQVFQRERGTVVSPDAAGRFDAIVIAPPDFDG